jgi:hypothetical protein
MNMTIARQRFSKHVPEVMQSTVEGTPLLGSKLLGMYLPQRTAATINADELLEMVIYIQL